MWRAKEDNYIGSFNKCILNTVSFYEVMNILFIKENKLLMEELREYIHSLDAHAFFADDAPEMLDLLQYHCMDLVIIPLRALSDLEILRFINEKFKETKVVITVDRTPQESDWNNRKALYSNYDLLKKQLRLFELKKAIGSGLDFSPN